MLGWKDKLAERLSTLLSDSSTSSSNYYSHRSGLLDSSSYTLLPSESPQQGVTDSESEPYRPDTSSLSDFLLSLLPAASPGSNEYNATHRVENEASSSSNLGASTGRKRQNGQSIKKDRLFEDKLECEPQGTRDEESGVYGDSNERQLETETHMKTSDTLDQCNVPQNMMLSLPELSDESSFLSENICEFVHASLPTLVRGCQWILLYSTEKHGISLLTLLRKSADLPGPCLLVTGDMQGAVFGGLLNGPLIPTPKRKYQGTNETFVFTTLYGAPRLFRPTGANRYYYLCMNDLLAFGGGGNFALCIDGDLLNGTSGPCQTFGNLCLAYSPEFSLKNVELWGFAHLSRYL